MGCGAREPLHGLAAQLREAAIFEGEPASVPQVYSAPTVTPGGHFPIGIGVGEQTVRLPRLNGIPRKALTLGYPAPAYLEAQEHPLPS